MKTTNYAISEYIYRFSTCFVDSCERSQEEENIETFFLWERADCNAPPPFPQVNSGAFSEGWMIKVKMTDGVPGELMDAAGYKASIEE